MELAELRWDLFFAQSTQFGSALGPLCETSTFDAQQDWDIATSSAQPGLRMCFCCLAWATPSLKPCGCCLQGLFVPGDTEAK
eukprot:1880391-Pyramimonas_sp.AAC.1